MECDKGNIILFLTKISIFDQNYALRFDFWWKLQFLFKILISDGHFGCLLKFRLLVKKSSFIQNFDCWPKFRFVIQKFWFWPKFWLLPKISIITQNFDFCSKFHIIIECDIGKFIQFVLIWNCIGQNYDFSPKFPFVHQI